MILNAATSQLLIVDIQEKLVPVITNKERVIERTSLLARAAERLQIPTLISEQNPKGLGPTVPPIMQAISAPQVLAKIAFSCAADQAMAQHLLQQNRKQLLLTGMETHICVCQSALGFKDMGFDVFVVEDACSSFSESAAATGIQRLRAAGIHIVNAEMVIFEWLQEACNDRFKKMMDIIKELRASK